MKDFCGKIFPTGIIISICIYIYSYSGLMIAVAPQYECHWLSHLLTFMHLYRQNCLTVGVSAECHIIDKGFILALHLFAGYIFHKQQYF